VVVSHGYPGSRYLLAYLCENLASKGYVVVSIDHTDSTYRDVASFVSTVVNRSLD
jgi:predicted dienelactone hydrolase